MKKHLPFLLVFYLVLVLLAMFVYVYTDTRKQIDDLTSKLDNRIYETYNDGWTDGFTFASKSYEDDAASPSAVDVLDIPGLDASHFPRVNGILYSSTDKLSRPGAVYALLHQDILPSAPRSSLKTVTPVGYQSLQFDFISSGGWLYNRTHLLGSLLGGKSDVINIVTGTQYLNQVIMYPYEAELYTFLCANPVSVRVAVIPQYFGDELLPRGIYYYASTVDDDSFFVSVYLPNIQPGVTIDYLTGNAAPAFQLRQ